MADSIIPDQPEYQPSAGDVSPLPPPIRGMRAAQMIQGLGYTRAVDGVFRNAAARAQREYPDAQHRGKVATAVADYWTRHRRPQRAAGALSAGQTSRARNPSAAYTWASSRWIQGTAALSVINHFTARPRNAAGAWNPPRAECLHQSRRVRGTRSTTRP